MTNYLSLGVSLEAAKQHALGHELVRDGNGEMSPSAESSAHAGWLIRTLSESCGEARASYNIAAIVTWCRKSIV